MPDYTIGLGDLRPAITETLTQSGEPLDLTGAVGVDFLATRADGHNFGGACTIPAPSLGQVAYVPVDDDTQEPGIYQVEFVVTWSEGAFQTIPNHRVATLEIR